MNDGFCSVLVFPSPNDHSHDVGVFVDVSVNWMASGIVPDVGVALKPATGAKGAMVVVVVTGSDVGTVVISVVTAVVMTVVATDVGTVVAIVAAAVVTAVVTTVVGTDVGMVVGTVVATVVTTVGGADVGTVVTTVVAVVFASSAATGRAMPATSMRMIKTGMKKVCEVMVHQTFRASVQGEGVCIDVAFRPPRIPGPPAGIPRAAVSWSLVTPSCCAAAVRFGRPFTELFRALWRSCSETPSVAAAAVRRVVFERKFAPPWCWRGEPAGAPP